MVGGEVSGRAMSCVAHHCRSLNDFASAPESCFGLGFGNMFAVEQEVAR